MVLLTFVRLFISYVVKTGDASLSAEFMNKFALPEQHDVLLRFFGFFLKLR